MDMITERNLADFSDLYKDAYGFRPRDQFTWFRGLSHEEQAAEIDRVAQAVREAIAAEKAAAEEPIEDLGLEDSYEDEFEFS
jgi:predicted TPR repeat methyltransferase